jgi:hypothetical protein
MVSDDPGRTVFLESQFWVHVKVTPPGDELLAQPLRLGLEIYLV